MSIVESDGPPSWSLDASETGESTKCPWVGVVEGTAGEKIGLTPTFLTSSRLPTGILYSPQLLNDRHLRSHGKIGDCEQSNLLTMLFTFFKAQGKIKNYIQTNY